ncbi:MAG TPA: thymidine phosphorylase [Verrucomicrobiales bacterium]|nr:thymidine phosphorylase [Verrucomicrobiales bacterium]
MHVPSLIEKKRDGQALAEEEIHALIRAFTLGELPDYQMSALAMAVYFQGMTASETAALTHAMLHSGIVLSWPAGSPPRVDKHSTGGIGDKTSLVLAPLLACDGLWVPMISGRGLGITGGTLDKLESIPGFRTRLEEKEIHRVVSDVGCVMVGQTEGLCPADKKLYALRDVTATVPSIPLITASIMGKKLAEGLDRLVLDVKHGTGAFMRTKEQARALADSMVAVGTALGVRCAVRINAMSEPTGRAAGNALEVAECAECLQGRGPADLEDIVLDLAGAVSDTPRATHGQRLRDGSAWRKFQQMTAAQGGDISVLEKITKVHAAPVIIEVPAPASGIVRRMDAGTIGRAVLALGAGRSRASDPVDFAVGVDRIVKTGESVTAGAPLLRVHARTPAAAEAAMRTILEGVEIR